MTAEAAPSSHLFSPSIPEIVRSQKEVSRLLSGLQVTNDSIEKIEQHCESIIQLFLEAPVNALACISLYKRDLTSFDNFLLNISCVTCLFCLRNNWNKNAVQQTLAGIVCWAICNKPYYDKVYAGIKPSENAKGFKKLGKILHKALSALDRQLWLESFTSLPTEVLLKPQIAMSQLQNSSQTSQILATSYYFVFLTTPNRRIKSVSIASALKKIISGMKTDSAHIEPLLQTPGLIWPGNLIKLTTDEIHLVVDELESNWLVRPLNKKDKPISRELFQIDKAQKVTILPNMPLVTIDAMANYWNEEWFEQRVERGSRLTELHSHSFRIDQPPASLLAIIEHLEQHDIDVNELCALIEKEPSFVSHLQSSATQTGREKLPISDVKHGLMMHGFERSKCVLTQHALLTRLNQHYFPLQDSLYQFLKLWSQIAGILAENHKSLLAEEVSNWVYFSFSGLFTNIELKSKTRWQLKTSQVRDQSCLANIKQASQLNSHAQRLAQCWLQDIELKDALKELQLKHKLPASAARSKAHLVIQISMHLAVHYYFDGGEAPFYDEFLLQLCSEFGLSNEYLGTIDQQVLERTHTYCPISTQLISAE
ncbi:MAG: hypothetical protein GJ680_08900 [Alteromonadaceae bacterium]|nr:hypothetical protein [Alteromonadaceae bacterium]